MDATVYNREGKKAGSVTLPGDVFDVAWNPDLVHQVMVSMMSNARSGTAHTKDRSEVRGGGRKPWRQKGTGRARHGSRRSPIWRTGGITFGPRNEKNYSKKINRKMKAKALYTVLSQKLRDGEVIFVDTLSFENPKTAEAKQALKSLGGIKGFEDLATRRKNAACIAIHNDDTNAQKSFANMGNVAIESVKDLNVLNVLNSKYVIITHPEESVPLLSKRLAGTKIE